MKRQRDHIFNRLVWPIMFSTSHVVRWFNFASSTQMVRTIILPAIMADVMAGVRAVGVAWVVLVPAEWPAGVINDARDTLAHASGDCPDNWNGYTLDSKLVNRFNW